MHDPTVDRVSNGRGEVRSLLFSELRELNVSFWDGPHDTGRRLPEPTRTQSQIPTLEEVLVFLKGNVLLNIQVYEQSIAGLKTLSDLYRKYHLYNEAFLMVESFAVAEQIRDMDPAIELCVGEARSNLERHKQFGVNFIQPTKDLINWDLGEIKSAFKFGAQLATTRVMAQIQNRVPYLIISKAIGIDEVAYYNIAARVINAAKAIINAGCEALIPASARYKKTNKRNGFVQEQNRCMKIIQLFIFWVIYQI